MNQLSLPDADLADAALVPEGGDAAVHGRHLSALALIYLRHAAPARAMVLGLAAMTMGDLRPQTVLLVAEALIEAGDPEQALAVLARFDDDPSIDAGSPARLDVPATQAQIAARHYLTARVLYRQGRPEAARAEMDRAIELAGVAAP